MTRKERIDQLKKELETLAGGKFHSWTSEKMPAEMEERFLKDVLAFETAPMTTNFDQLVAAGVALPNPDDVPEADIHSTLWGVIHGLAELGVFLDQTDHLNDRELYSVLWKDVLREEVPMLPKDSQGSWHVDLPGGDPESRQYLKFYADDDFRKNWQEEFPDYEMPAHEDPPHDRDRLLPVPSDQDDDGLRH